MNCSDNTLLLLRMPNASMCVQVKAQDIAANMRADKQNLRMEELDLLFQMPSLN